MNKSVLEERIGRPLPFSKTFAAGDDFSAYTAACAWLTKHGLDYGSMEGGRPIGIARGACISKWTNLGNDVVGLDGAMVSESFRNGGVTIYLIKDPVTA